MSRLNMWSWVRPFLILLLVVSVPPLLYWFGYVQNSVLAEQRRAYATLSAVTVEFKDRLAEHKQIAQTAAEHVPPDDLETYLGSVLKGANVTPVGTQELRAGVARDTGELQIPVKLSLKAKAACSGSKPCEQLAKMPLEPLIPWNIVATEFDGLLVLANTGELLAQDRRLPTQPVGMKVALKSIESDEASAGSAEKKPTAAPPAFRSPLNFTNHPSITLAGVDYLAFQQTLSVPVAEGVAVTGATSLRVVGLLRTDRLRTEAIQLSPQTLIAVGSIVALMLFALPFLKLRFIGEKERMHPRDMWLLGVAMLCATALMTLVMLDAHAMMKLRERFDGGLGQFAAAVVRHVRTERMSAIAELRESAPRLAGKPVVFTATLDDLRSGDDTKRELTGFQLAREDFSAYPDFEALYITDRSGQQRGKWMTRTKPTPLVPVGAQPYFAPALSATAYSLPPEACGVPFSTTVARTSGLQLGLFALPLHSNLKQIGTETALTDRVGLAVIAAAMSSVNSPVVPQPFEYVLVDRSGRVTFQSTRTSYRGERFFEAVRGGSALERSARIGATSHPAAYEYRGRVYRMQSIDVPELQLTLVAFYNRDIIGMLAARAFLTSVTFVLGIIASILAGAFASAAIFRRTAFEWIWPSPSRTPYYVAGSIACVLTVPVLLLALAYLAADALAGFMLAAPFFIVLTLGSGRVIEWTRPVLTRVLNAFRRKDQPDNPTQLIGPVESALSLEYMSASYRMFAVLALLAFIALPAFVVFKDAYVLHAAAYTQEVAADWAAAKARWQAENDTQLVVVGASARELRCTGDQACHPDRIYVTPANRQRVIEGRTLGLYDVCANLIEDEGKCRVDAVAASPFSATARTASWLARLDPDDAGVAETLARVSGERSSSPRPRLLQGRDAYWIAGGGLLLICILWLLVKSIARHVLGIEVTSKDILDEGGRFVPVDGSRWLLLRPSHQLVKKLTKDCGACYQPYDLSRGGSLPQFKSPAAGSVVLVEHVETVLAEKSSRDAILPLLRDTHAGCVVLVSEIDPLHYLTQRVREKCDYILSMPATEKEKRKEADQSCRELRTELAAWATALRGVEKIRVNRPAFPAPGNGVDARWHAKIAVECGGTEQLICIGERLLARADLNGFAWREVVSLVLDAAEPHYRSIWELCSREERLVLIQLAQSGLVNPKRLEVVRRLARRGLIVVDPRYRLMNESFERFVSNVEPHERIVEWERTPTALSWSRLATPLYALAAMIVAILLFTEQGVFTSALAIATGAAGALGSFRNIYASFSGSPGAGKVA